MRSASLRYRPPAGGLGRPLRGRGARTRSARCRVEMTRPLLQHLVQRAKFAKFCTLSCGRCNNGLVRTYTSKSRGKSPSYLKFWGGKILNMKDWVETRRKKSACKALPVSDGSHGGQCGVQPPHSPRITVYANARKKKKPSGFFLYLYYGIYWKNAELSWFFGFSVGTFNVNKHILQVWRFSHLPTFGTLLPNYGGFILATFYRSRQNVGAILKNAILPLR